MTLNASWHSVWLRYTTIASMKMLGSRTHTTDTHTNTYTFTTYTNTPRPEREFICRMHERLLKEDLYLCCMCFQLHHKLFISFCNQLNHWTVIFARYAKRKIYVIWRPLSTFQLLIAAMENGSSNSSSQLQSAIAQHEHMHLYFLCANILSNGTQVFAAMKRLSVQKWKFAQCSSIHLCFNMHVIYRVYGCMPRYEKVLCTNAAALFDRSVGDITFNYSCSLCLWSFFSSAKS